MGTRTIELLSYREKAPKRKTEVLDILKFIHSVAWPHMFGRPADDLQQAAAHEDEYMISDHDLATNRYVSVPKSYGSFNPGALVAGMIRVMLESAGFRARVSAHTVDQKGPGVQGKKTTTFLIKFDPSVMQREALIKGQMAR